MKRSHISLIFVALMGAPPLLWWIVIKTYKGRGDVYPMVMSVYFIVLLIVVVLIYRQERRK